MTKSIAAALMLMTSLTACGTVISDCPKPTEIPVEIQKQAAEEMKALSSGSALNSVLAASLNDRDKLRACRKIR